MTAGEEPQRGCLKVISSSSIPYAQISYWGAHNTLVESSSGEVSWRILQFARDLRITGVGNRVLQLCVPLVHWA